MVKLVSRYGEQLAHLLQFPNIEDNDERLRIWIVQRLFIFALVSNTLVILLVRDDLAFTIQVGLGYPIILVGYLLFKRACRRGKSKRATATLTSASWLWILLLAYGQGPFDSHGYFHMISIAIVLATLLLGTRAGLVSFIAAILAGLLLLWLEANYAPLIARVPVSRNMQFVSFILVAGLIFGLVATGRDQLTKALAAATDARAQSEARRTALAKANADIEWQIRERTRELEATLQQQDDLLRIVAHDLKNPLASVALSLDMLIRYPDKLSPEHREKRLRLARGAVDDMTSTISRLLEASRIEAGQVMVNREMVALLPLVKTVVNDFEQQARTKSIDLKIIGKEPLTTWADGQLLGQVLANLVSNAVKYSPVGTRVEVRWVRQEKSVALSVSDEGQGLTLDDMSKLYRKFTRLSAVPTAGESSAGLGLYIVKLFTEAMSGSVSAESAGRNLGTTFTVYLPLAECKAPLHDDIDQATIVVGTP